MVELSESFWLTLLATAAAVLGLIVKKMSASKCDEISCWGIRVHRRVELELDDIESKTDSVRPAINNI